MKPLFSVIDRFNIRSIAAQWFETFKGSNHKTGETAERFVRKSFEEASHDAIIGIYMFKAQARELEDSKKDTNTSTYNKTVKILSDTFKEFDNIEHTQTMEENQSTLLHISLLSSSINSSLSRLAELLDTFANEKIDQKKESTTSALAEAERICDALYEQYNVKKSDDQLSKNVEEKLEDLDKTITTLQQSVQAL
jgi:hypothetical protein